VTDRRGRPVAVAVALLFAVPLAALVVRALADEWRAPALLPQAIGIRGFEVAFGGGTASTALATSLLVACASTMIALALGWPAARVLGERRLRRPGLMFVLLAMPILVPPYAIGSGLTEWFLRLGLAGTVVGLVLAHLVVVLPYVVVVLLSGFGSRLTELEEMAQTFGAGSVARFTWVTVPSIRPTVAAAVLIGFLVSWSQYGSSLAVGAGRPLLPVLLVPFVGTDPQVAATLGLLFLAPAVFALVAAIRLSRAPL
jgi:putative spermidine/putrescine transport system permease protein